MRSYLVIKNTIISLLLTVMYEGWLVEGINTFKIISACVVIFIFFMIVFNVADFYYIKERAHQARKAKMRSKINNTFNVTEKGGKVKC